MDLHTQFKLLSDDLAHQYIRQNSYWYKRLNRNPLLYESMIDEMKDKYKLKLEDKIENFSEKLRMVEMFMNVLR